MSWISESNNEGYWSNPEERAKFNEFWDTPYRRKWVDNHDEDFLLYLWMLKDAKEKEVEKYPRAVYNRKPYYQILKDLDPVPKPKEPKVRTNVSEEEMIRLRDEAIAEKRARLMGEEPKKKPKLKIVSGECPKHPDPPAKSVRQTKMPMRDANPNRPGWKLPRKPYGHAREVVELEDDLSAEELKKMTSELPRRCLVDAVQDWAKGHNKIVLPSITRADKAEIVATIKEHRIPVPRLSGGGYYGDGMDDDIFTGGQKHIEVHLCPDCRMGDDEWDWIENERRTTQPYEIAGGADPAEEADEPEEEELAFVCEDCGERIMVSPGDPAYDGRREINGVWYCGDCAPDHLDEEEEPEEDYETDSGPEGADTPRRSRSPDMDGGRAIGQKSGRDDTDYDTDTDDDGAAAAPVPPPLPAGDFVCGECGDDVRQGTREWRGRAVLDDGTPLCGHCADNVSASEESTEDEDLEGGAKPIDKALYERAKAEVYPKYKKPSAYRSGALIKRYKELGGRFKDTGGKPLARWFKEEWKDVGNKSYPVYRPTKRITKDTPLTPDEIDPKNLQLQIAEKQRIKGKKNLPAFQGKGADDEYLKKAKAFAKKAGYKNWNNLKYATDGVHKLELDGVKFGRKGYGDFIEYGIEEGPKSAQKHRKAYLARATNIKGDWKEDPMSKNNLAIKVLWGGSPFFHLRGGAKMPALPPDTELVSKKESPVVEEIIEEPMDDGDIRAYYPNAKIMRYSDLRDYKTITQLLPKDKSYAFLLYQHAPNQGHWVLLMRYGTTIEFFCSYGSAIDAPLKWTNPKDRQMLGEAVPYLSNLLKAQNEFNVIHNPVAYQAKGNDKATCGAHDVMRLTQMLKHGQDLTDYYDYMTKIKKESGLSYDEIVANFVSKR